MDGEVKIEKKRLGRGECFGYVALVSINKHNVSAVAMGDRESLGLTKSLLGKLRHEDSELFSLLILNIARALARRLQFTDGLLLKAIRGSEPRDDLPEIVGR